MYSLIIIHLYKLNNLTSFQRPDLKEDTFYNKSVSDKLSAFPLHPPIPTFCPALILVHTCCIFRPLFGVLWFFQVMEGALAVSVWDVEFHPCPDPISSATKSEPSSNHASHSSGNGYTATQLMCGSKAHSASRTVSLAHKA